MKRVMRKIFVSVLALAMIVGIIGVQKMNVSAAEEESYSHVDIQTKDVNYVVNTTAYGAAESTPETFNAIKSIISVKLVGYKDLQFSRQDDTEYGYVLDKDKVTYEGSIYKKNAPKWDGLRFSKNDFTAIEIVAILKNAENERKCTITISAEDAIKSNSCKGTGEWLGLDITLTGSEDVEVEGTPATVKVQHIYNTIVCTNGVDGEPSSETIDGDDINTKCISDVFTAEEIEELKDSTKEDFTCTSYTMNDSDDFTVTGDNDVIKFVYEKKVIVNTANVTVIHRYITKKDNVIIDSEEDTDTETYKNQVVGDTITIKAVNKAGFSNCPDISHEVDDEKNEVTFNYYKEIPVEEEKPIINDYTPVVIIEEKKEEVVEIIEEEVPEAPVEEPVEEEEEVVEEIEVEIPEIPEALPKTGTASVELFFGLGSFFMTIGAAFVLFARRKN